MSLEPDGLAALTLRLCRGRYFDYECCPIDDEQGRRILNSAIGIVDGGALTAQTAVKDWHDVAPFLVSRANEISFLRKEHENNFVSSALDGAEVFIRSAASNIAAGDNSDGPAMPFDPYTHDRCALLGLAAIIQARIQRLYCLEGAVPSDVDLQINYITTLAEDARDFAPFCIDGKAIIRRSPRLVHLVLKADAITSRDLWHIAHTLHHELICHIFQGARSIERLEDAHPNCHWSEGWMDTLTFDLVSDWDEAPIAWLPLRGERALGEIRRFHEHRYVAARLSDNDKRRRCQARDAYRKLVKVLFHSGLCNCEADARARVRRFSLAANAHPEASSKRLKQLSSRLIGLLLTAPARQPEAGIAAARACLDFTKSNNLAKLEQEIEAAERI